MFFSADLHVWIDKIVQRGAFLSGGEFEIPSLRELHPVHVMCAKEIIVFLLVLPGLRNIDRHPPHRIKIKLGPAVVPGNLGGMLVGREREAYLKARWNLLR